MARRTINASAKTARGQAAKSGRTFLFRLPQGTDILEEIAAFCQKRRILCATVQIIGATSKVTIGYYDQKLHDYHKKTFRQEMEILSCAGNVSLKDGKPFLHLHATMGDTKLKVWGGHLFSGSKVFAAEAHILELKGPLLVRRPDPATGLLLWHCP